MQCKTPGKWMSMNNHPLASDLRLFLVCFISSYLPRGRKVKLSTVATILLEQYLPMQLRRYAELNVSASSSFSAYLPEVPSYLQNRPKKVVTHCLSRKLRSNKYEPGKYMCSLSFSCKHNVYLFKSQSILQKWPTEHTREVSINLNNMDNKKQWKEYTTKDDQQWTHMQGQQTLHMHQKRT